MLNNETVPFSVNEIRNRVQSVVTLLDMIESDAPQHLIDNCIVQVKKSINILCVKDVYKGKNEKTD